MKKKLVSAMLCVAMAASLTVGCGQKDEPAKEPVKDTEDKKAETPKEPEGVTADAVDQKKVYVSPEWVQSVIDGNQKESDDYVILQCGWGEETDDTSYGEGHIKGSYHMNTDYIEEEQYWNIRTPEEIEALAAKYGITKDTTVICYSSGASNSADDRVAFTMLWAGVENVKCLDGGLEAWVNASYELEKESNTPEAATEAFGTTVPAHPEYIYSIDEVKDKLENDDNFKLVSIRSYDEFTGKTSGYGYIKKAGEPKGAIWGHDTDDNSYLKEDGTTADVDVLEGYLAESGASMDNDLAFYCGTGWRATIPFLLSYEEGYTNIHLYDGGWFQWQMDDTLPVQVGDPKDASCVYTTVSELPNDKAPQ